MSGAKVEFELWLVRHGETEWSADGRHTSTTDIPLTEHGRERARELREYLAGRRFAAVLVSPMQRAQETCAIAGYGDVAQVDDDLKEWNYGESEGRTTKEMRAKYGPEWSVWTSPIVGGESVEQVGARADRVIAKALAIVQKPTSQNRDAGRTESVVMDQQKADPSAALRDDKAGRKDDGSAGANRVALFAHAHLLRILTARWIALPPADGAKFALSTGSVSVLGFERETRVVSRWNRSFEDE